METYRNNNKVDKKNGCITCKNIFSIPGITGFIIMIIGLALFFPGIKLIHLGGSWYYSIAGLALAASGYLILIRQRTGLWIYGLTLLVTYVWALSEVGLDGWKLMPRLLAPAIIGFWLCMPCVAGKLQRRREYSKKQAAQNATLGAVGCVLIIAFVIVCGYRVTAIRNIEPSPIEAAGPISSHIDPGSEDEWRYYGHTTAGDRFSTLAQITPQNVSNLKVAWKVRAGDMPLDIDTKKGREFNFEDTPTKVGDNLYICTPHHKVISINATTGKRNWDFDPQTDQSANIFLACRGVAYYESKTDSICPRRIITTTGTAKMVALNADTGKPCENFGDNGFVSLTDHMGDVPPGFHFITSQPLVIKDRIILGGWIYDDQTTGEPSGVVRAYNPENGQLAWAWDLGNEKNPNAILKPGEIYTRGTPNAWGVYTADPALGLVYLPLGNATPDYFGGNRTPADEKYSSAVVALDIETGKERWHFQTVHHDVWDFDLPIGPSLFDLKTDHGIVPALIQTTKRGDFFMLDRRTGESLTPIEEVKAPQNPIAGDYLSPTQPYPQGMPTVAPDDIKEVDTWGATPLDQLMCRIDYHERRYDGKFTPPTLGKYLAYPAFYGVTDWFGASIDPARNLLVINSSYLPMVMDMMSHEDAQKNGYEKPWSGWDSKQPYPKLTEVSNNPQYGTPYAIVIKPWLNKLNVPCIAPPWGKLTAINLNTKQIAWQHILGTTRKAGLFGTHVGVPLPTGMFSMGGNIITASGLVFIGGTGDDNFRAFDEATGKVLWQTSLPAGGNATPITYKGTDGRQYVVIVAGGHGGLKTIAGDYIVAYALPDK